ncbi:DUF5590 domain-containing protein [Paenibacillus brevis]|uniref:DUF5590 domain-containing protein n=1 Tax=Paenibacillus brevis TaxID=2841508 RepID=A0ABS6FW29_9BACL|nr:DUF5590 domain-containing protein [Paenibacillus brevis]MBU5674438.1 DUF5590 domain-containing protein [Paenibacillus brevis]
MRNRTKWILLSFIILAFILLGLYRFYLYVYDDTWQAENLAVQRAKAETTLVKSDEVWKSVWDKVCWVVEGQNEDGEQVMVWLPEGGQAEVKLLSEGVSESQVRSIIKEELPNSTIVRLMPGIYENEYVWQVFYKEKAHHYYKFYRFSDGKPLDEVFTLPNR